MRQTRLIAALLASVLCASSAEREVHWREDIEFLLARISAKGTSVDLQRGISARGQKDYDKLYPHLAADLKELESETGSLSDAQIILRLMKLIAAPNVAHNSVQMPIGSGSLGHLPLGLQWYSDGLAVVLARDAYTDALGTYVRRFGDKTPEQVLATGAPYIAHENDAWLRTASPVFMRSLMILEEAGVSDANGEVVLTLQKPGSAPFTITVKAVDGLVKAQSIADVLKPPVPLFRSQTGKRYWHRYLEESATLFIQYNECENDPKLPFSEFSKMVLADADSHSVKRVVIDLRNNSGGDSRVINPLLNGLEQRASKLGHFYVLIGGNTFSSGMDNAVTLQQRLRATLAGEPSGGKPSSYGEVKTITLPNSKLAVRYTSKWSGSHNDSDPDALQPELRIGYTLADELAGRDPVLDAVIAR